MPSTKPKITDHHINRINKALRFVEDNLEGDLTLEIVADIAHYSPFHFHRIFKAVTNETLNTYITRKRIEKAASVLLRQRHVSVSELSLQYGFSSNASFTRAFKRFYGINPTLFRKENSSKYSKISKVESKNGQEKPPSDKYICNMENHIKWIEMNAKIEIKELEKLTLACYNQIGVQGVPAAFDKLMKWARPKRLMENPDLKMAIIYHDSLKITDHDKARMSVCMVLSESVETEGEIGITTIEAGKYIVGRVEVTQNEFGNAWSSLFVWMNENGYKKADTPPFGIYHNNFNEHPEKKSIADLCIPIE